MPANDSRNEVSNHAFPSDFADAITLERMSTDGFLAHLKRLGIDLRAANGKLQLNAPAGAITAELQAQLRERKPALLAHLNAEDQSEIARVAPLTFAQQRLWLIDRFSPHTLAYNIPQSWIVNAEIDLTVLQSAVDRLAERHSALRTYIEIRNGEPVQVVLRRVHIPVAFTDLSVESPPVQEAQLNVMLVQEGKKPFAFDQAPLIRFHLFRLAADRNLVAYSIHHIIADQWSLNTLKRDLAALYSESISGSPTELPVLSLQYADLAVRERSQTTQQLHLGQLDYWRKRLSGMPMLLELPFSKRRPTVQSYDGETLSIKIEASLTAQLSQLSLRSNSSLFFVMLSVFAALIYRYTQQRDLCLGTPITGRKRREEEDILGLFVNLLPLRFEIDPDRTFFELLTATRDTVLADFENSDVPFQQLVTDLHPHRSQAYSPIFQIMFALNPKGSDVEVEQQETFIGISKYDLTLQIAEQAQTLEAHFEYRSDLFSADEIAKFAEHFVRLAEAVAAAPTSPIESLPLLTQEDKDSIARWNATEREFDRDATLVTLFEEQVARHPQSIALCCDAGSYTFAELNDRADRQANSLRELGVKSGDFVALCLDRSPHLIVSLLAVLKAGAAYLPLDPKYPEERLLSMLEDSGARFLIAQNGDLAKALSSRVPGLIVLFAEDTPNATAAESKMPRGDTKAEKPAGQPSDAAYLIYTSGSTGKPKGVVVEHRNAVALMAWASEYFESAELRGILASTSICFDLSVFEIFLPLSTGNTIVLINEILELPKSGHAEKVTLVNTVPSAMSALLEVGLPSSVHTVCMAGELLPTELVDRVYACGVRKVIDLYGPTETTTYSTAAVRLLGAPASIGKPIANTRLYLLDQNLSQVPPGSIGEIFIGGEGVTRGYLNRPQLTAERYLTLPAIESRSLLYRTGDLARQLQDGSLAYLGRRDQQIKLRGHRIELGEIEAALREASGVFDVAVVVQVGGSGDSLVAFIANPLITLATLNEYLTKLRTKLPGYMVPSKIVPIASLPLTPNGKIDRKALSIPITGPADHSGELPRDLLEQWLTNIWSSRLKKAQIARDDDFFDDLGGHSLVAFEIFAMIERKMSVAMMLTTLFQAPTIALLASAIRRLSWQAPETIEFVASGTGDVVTYLLLQKGAPIPGEGKSIGRIMSINAEPSHADMNEIASEMAAFESSGTEIVLLAEGTRGQEAERLAAGLDKAGLTNVTIRFIE